MKCDFHMAKMLAVTQYNTCFWALVKDGQQPAQANAALQVLSFAALSLYITVQKHATDFVCLKIAGYSDRAEERDPFLAIWHQLQ